MFIVNTEVYVVWIYVKKFQIDILKYFTLNRYRIL